MAKVAPLYVLRAPGDIALATRLIERLRLQEGVRAEVFDIAKVRALPDPGAAWYVLLLSPELARQTPALDWVMDAHPDRVLPALARDCDPEAVHPRLAFLVPHDLRAATDEAIGGLRREWQKQGIGREKPAASILLFLGEDLVPTGSRGCSEHCSAQEDNVRYNLCY